MFNIRETALNSQVSHIRFTASVSSSQTWSSVAATSPSTSGLKTMFHKNVQLLLTRPNDRQHKQQETANSTDNTELDSVWISGCDLSSPTGNSIFQSTCQTINTNQIRSWGKIKLINILEDQETFNLTFQNSDGDSKPRHPQHFRRFIYLSIYPSKVWHVSTPGELLRCADITICRQAVTREKLHLASPEKLAVVDSIGDVTFHTQLKEV